MNRRSRILVVDDNATNTRILVKSLQKAGYEVLEANDGFCAVDLATAHTPDVILLDLMMPDRDGFEVLPHTESPTNHSGHPHSFF